MAWVSNTRSFLTHKSAGAIPYEKQNDKSFNKHLLIGYKSAAIIFLSPWCVKKYFGANI